MDLVLYSHNSVGAVDWTADYFQKVSYSFKKRER